MQKRQNATNVLGIDGCRSGWCVAKYSNHGFGLDVYPSFEKILKGLTLPFEVLIDIPIGLGDKDIVRDLDTMARRELRPNRHQTVFTAPNRNAAYAKTYEEAKYINLIETGKKISLQSWNISSKIKEIDIHISSNFSLQGHMHEAHPEICFKYLNRGKLLETRKSDPGERGLLERIGILSEYESRSKAYYEKAMEELNLRAVKKDDIIDAMCLAIVAKHGLLYGFNKIYGSNKTDAQKIPMCMYYYDPRQN